MRLRQLLTSGTAALAMAAGSLALAAPAAAAGPVPVPVDATVFVEVEPVGARVTTVVVEYSRKVDLSAETLDPATAFDVVATLVGNELTSTAPRTVVDAWTTTENDPAAPPRRQGKFLVLELDIADRGSGYGYRGGEKQYDLDGAYAVTQTRDLNDGSPSKLVPAWDTAVTNSSTRVLVVEDFRPGVFTASNGVSLDYRLYEPTTRGSNTYPLVLALHGIGGTGTGNLAPVLNNQLATAFAAPERQAEDPSFVLVPQRKPTQGMWSAPDMTTALLELVEDAKQRLPVDADRVYLTGNSMGGNGSWAVTAASPDTFAAAVIVCGWTTDPRAASSIEGVPTWAHHSVDDPAVSYADNGASHDVFRALEAAGTEVTWGEWPGNLPVDEAARHAADLWEQAEQQGSEHLFTTYPAGTTPVSGHHSWIPTYSNPVVLDWMFAQVRDSGRLPTSPRGGAAAHYDLAR